jgi:tetratricopeptide (TPR) repeat protein
VIVQSNKGKSMTINLADVPGFQELDARFSASVKSGHYQRAISICRKILALAKKTGLSKKNPFLAVVYANLGSCLGNETDYEGAERSFLKAVTIAGTTWTMHIVYIDKLMVCM